MRRRRGVKRPAYFSRMGHSPPPDNGIIQPAMALATRSRVFAGVPNPLTSFIGHEPIEA